MCCYIGEIGGFAEEHETWTSVERMGKPFEVHGMKIYTEKSRMIEGQRQDHKDKNTTTQKLETARNVSKIGSSITTSQTCYTAQAYKDYCIPDNIEIMSAN